MVTIKHRVSLMTDTVTASALGCANCGTPLKLPGKGRAGVTCHRPAGLRPDT
jgi:hypothetical protein